MLRIPLLLAAASGTLAACATPDVREDPVPAPSEPAAPAFPALSALPAADLPATPPPRTEERAEEDVLEDLRALERKVVRGWSLVWAPPYALLRSAETPAARVRELGRHLQAMLDVFRERFPPARPLPRVFVVRVCADEDQYAQYGGPGGSTSYFAASAGEAVGFVSREDETALLRLAGTAFFPYLHGSTGSDGSAPWFEYGFSTFFASFHPGSDGRPVPVPHPVWRGKARSLKAEGTFLPLREFMRLSHRDFLGRDLARNVPQAWSLAWFLSMQEDPRWKGIPERSYVALRDHLAALDPTPEGGPSPEQEETAREAAWKAAFGEFTDADWTALERAWRAFPD